MSRMYGWNDILVMPDDLRAFAWSAPMRDLAAKLDMSDVGLRKLLAACGVAPPPQGYWNKVRAGKPVPNRPKAPPRRPGEIGRVRLDPRFAKVLSPAAPMSSTGPFASPLVPEDLEELRAVETKAIGRATVPKSLEAAHRGLRELLSKEARRREKVANSRWHWDEPKFDNPVARRRLRILNGIFLALSKRGHDGNAYERDGEIHASVTVGDTHLGIDIGIHGKHRMIRIAGYMRPAPDLPASTPLMVRLDPTFDGKAVETWCDDQQGKLEDKLVEIVAGIIVAGEARFRRSLREAEEQAERQRLEVEKRRQEQLAELNRQRITNLFKSGELLRQAQDIRSLVARVRTAIAEGSEISADELSAWERWALAEADRIDPVRSGQFMSHLRPPALDSN
jgi:hypothetical protein